MQNQSNNALIGLFLGLFSFLQEHYPKIREALILLCDRVENGLIAKLFPKGLIATKIKPAIPLFRELIERLDEIINTAN